jgi:hypothetical protein
MGKSWLDSIKSKAKEVLGGYVESRLWTIPEEMVNTILESYISGKGSIKELKSLSVKALDGQFEVNAKGKKFFPFDSKNIFTIESCDISGASQTLVLRQIGKTAIEAQSIYAKIIVAIVQSIFATVLGVDPAKYLAGKQPGISIDGDNYIVDLSETPVQQYISHNRMVEGLVANVRIADIQCIPGKFLVKASLQGAEEIKMGTPSDTLSPADSKLKCNTIV